MVNARASLRDLWLVKALVMVSLFAGVSGWFGSTPTFVPVSFTRSLVSLRERNDEREPQEEERPKSLYDLGIGKNKPFDSDRRPSEPDGGVEKVVENWVVPEPVKKPADEVSPSQAASVVAAAQSIAESVNRRGDVVVPEQVRTRRMVARDDESQHLRKALWDETHYSQGPTERVLGNANPDSPRDDSQFPSSSGLVSPPRPRVFYPDIDMSIPESVYSADGSVDLVWDLLRYDAYQQAQREPLLVSFLHSTILNHHSLESSLAFLLANRLQSPAMMISTQLQSLILESLECPFFRRSLRADIMAVRDRDPACNFLPDVFLYFKGFHALQSHRVAHRMYNTGKQVLALYLQSQVSQIFQIDIHPNATLGSGIMLDHGTGIVIGETAHVGHNSSILHHVTLGGSGKKGVKRHPQVGDGVLLGAGATVLGPVTIGDGTQVGAGTLVISDLPAHCVAVGVPARIIGSFVDVTQQPSIGMDQMMDDRSSKITFESEGI